jgi:hypothetical protein
MKFQRATLNFSVYPLRIQQQSEENTEKILKIDSLYESHDSRVLNIYIVFSLSYFPPSKIKTIRV